MLGQIAYHYHTIMWGRDDWGMMAPLGHVDQKETFFLTTQTNQTIQTTQKLQTTHWGWRKLTKYQFIFPMSPPNSQTEIRIPSNRGFISQAKEEPHPLEPTKGPWSYFLVLSMSQGVCQSLQGHVQFSHCELTLANTKYNILQYNIYHIMI